MGNKNAPLGDDDIASSITLTGQFINKSSRSLAREYVANVLGHDKFEDIAVAGDTDSVVADAVIRTSCGNFTMEELYELCEERGGTTSISKTGHEFLTPSFDITTNCVDMDDCTMQNAKISKISKRKVKKEIYRLRADNGKYIDVTKDHSCIVMRNGKLISVKPVDIIKTDMLVIQK